MRRPPRGPKLERRRAPPVRVSSALTRRVPWYVLAGVIFGLIWCGRDIYAKYAKAYPCGRPPCNGRGECTNPEGEAPCACQEAWGGPFCEKDWARAEAERKAAEDAAWARLRQEETAAEEKAAQERERAADQPVAVAQGLIVDEDHQILYQTAAIRKLEIQGSSFCQRPSLAFQPPLTDGVDYSITRATSEKLSLTRKPHKKWRYEAGPLYLTSIQCGSDAPVELASGQGIVVATVLADPTIEASERKIYATLTKRLIVRGSGFSTDGFSTDGTELTLRPTSRSSYEVESVEMAEMVLILKEGKSWAPAKTKDDGKPVSIYVTKIDTDAGEVVMEDDGAIVARVFPDPSGDERAAAEERERAEEERVKRKKEARREQEEREERKAANEARLAAAPYILFYIVLPLSVCAVIAIGVVRVGAAIVADAASPVPVSSALTRCLLWYAVAGVISFFLFAPDPVPNGGGRLQILALIVACAIVIYWVKRNNPASGDDADAEMVPADATANPTLFRSMLNLNV